MCARIPISVDTCKGLCPPFHYTQTDAHRRAHARSFAHIHPATLAGATLSTFCHTLFSSFSPRHYAPETNYQSGVSSRIYLGQWGSYKHSSSLSFIFTICLSFHPLHSFSPSPSPSVAVLLRLEFYRWSSVSDPMKNCQRRGAIKRERGRERGKKKSYAALKSERSKGAVLCQTAFTQGNRSQLSHRVFGDVVRNKKGCMDPWPPLQLAALARQITLQTSSI